jgi:hypothetical protein
MYFKGTASQTQLASEQALFSKSINRTLLLHLPMSR